jgi:hypothetical protein
VSSVNFDEVDLNDDEKRIIACYFQTLSPERNEQKEMFKRVKDCYNGDYDEHYSHYFENVIADVDERANLVYDNPLFTKDVVSNTALIYREVPERDYILNDAPVNDDLKEYLDSIYKKMGNLGDSTLNQMVKALGTAEQEVYYHKSTRQIKSRVITPEDYDIIQDPSDPHEKIALIYEVESDDSANRGQQNITKFVYWDKNWHGVFKIAYKVTGDGQTTQYYPISCETSNYMENPYGEIPFVKVVDMETFSNYYQDNNAHIFDNSEQVLLIKGTGKYQTFVFQGFNVPVLTTGQPKKFEFFKLSPNTVQVMQKGSGQEGDDRFEFAVSSDMLTPTENAYDKAYASKLKVFGISEGDGSAQANQSGVSIALNDDQKNKIINADREKYVDFELKRFELIKKVNNYHATDAENDFILIPEETKLIVEFKPISTSISVDEEIKLSDHKLLNGLVSRADELKRLNPDLTDEQIQEKLAEIDQERAIVTVESESVE